jgi:DNA-binding response OmpR family regulator
MNFKTVLLLEDDRMLGLNLVEFLQHDGFQVTWCKSLLEANTQKHQNFDLYLLDLNLPDGNSFNFFKSLKQEKNCHVIIITAKNDADIRLSAFENKVSDFISKPFTYKELKIRIENVLATLQSTTNNYFNIEFNDTNFEINNLNTGLSSKLPIKEFKLLQFLCFNYPKTASRDDIINIVWGESADLNPRSIDNMILNLRKLLQNFDQIKIESVWGQGYRIVKLN